MRSGRRSSPAASAGCPSVGVMSLSLGLCALVYLPIAIAQWPTAVPSPNVLASIAVLAVVCTAGGVPHLRAR